MGKLLVIKGADFSNNAVETVSVKPIQRWKQNAFIYTVNEHVYTDNNIQLAAYYLAAGEKVSISLLRNGGAADTSSPTFTIVSLGWSSGYRVYSTNVGDVTVLKQQIGSTAIEEYSDYIFTANENCTLFVAFRQLSDDITVKYVP